MSIFQVLNPATGQLVEEYPQATDTEVEAALAATSEAYPRWKTVPIAERAVVLSRVAAIYRERTDELARLISIEMGKPVQQARGEVQLVAAIYDYYANEGPTMLADQAFTPASGGEAVIRTSPLGVILGIMPWNFPYYQVARLAAPNLLVGNTIILKHAPSCPSSALAIADIFTQAGLLDGAYVNLFADNDQVGHIIDDPRVQGVSLTGSERAGKIVAARAGQNLKKYVLELGGSDPFIVLDAENLETTVAQAIGGRFFNGGQACTAAKRFIVVDEVYDAFVGAFVSAVSSLKTGDPLEDTTFLGPMCSTTAADNLTAQVDDALAKGATALVGGKRVPGPGAFFEATVLTGVTTEMRAFREELFGPVAVVYRVAGDEEAVTLANNTSYGLGSAVFGGDPGRVQAIADRLEAGMVTVGAATGSEPDTPFGGVKRSGVGRELGTLGILEFTNRKLIRTPANPVR